MEWQGTGQWLRATHFPTPVSIGEQAIPCTSLKTKVISTLVFKRRSEQVGRYAKAFVLLRKVLWDLC